MIEQQIKAVVRNVPDFPEQGINFKDINPLLQNAEVCKHIINEFAAHITNTGVDAIVGIESRGFLFGMAIAQALQVPFIPIRKAGKLPGKTLQQTYNLEYGTATIELQVDAIEPQQKIWIHDDVLATGGTAFAAAQLVQKANAQVHGFCFVIELGFLNGRQVIAPISKNILTLAGY